MTGFAIHASALSRNFGLVKAVENLDLQVEKGSIFGFLGPNGSGKTTAIRMLTGLLRPSRGDVNVLGFALPKQAELLRLQIGYMTQKFSLYDDLTVKENLGFVAQIYGLGQRESKQRSEELLSVFGLKQKAGQFAGNLSGGQRQRLALAAATVHRPRLLFLDEPTSAVDPENRRDFWEHLFDLCDRGCSILVSTHYMDEAERCHRLAILESGVKRADGSPDELMQNIGANVVEVAGNDLRQLKQKLLALPEIISAAQLGARLRVLVNTDAGDPESYFMQRHLLPPANEMIRVRPSLEDVFVVSTGQPLP